MKFGSGSFSSFSFRSLAHDPRTYTKRHETGPVRALSCDFVDRAFLHNQKIGVIIETDPLAEVPPVCFRLSINSVLVSSKIDQFIREPRRGLPHVGEE